MKIRMLDGILGMFHGTYGVKRGDIVEIDDENATRYIASGLATAVLKGELPQPYQDTEEAVALRDEVNRKASAMVPEEARPRPNVPLPIGRRYSPSHVEGWSA